MPESCRLGNSFEHHIPIDFGFGSLNSLAGSFGVTQVLPGFLQQGFSCTLISHHPPPRSSSTTLPRCPHCHILPSPFPCAPASWLPKPGQGKGFSCIVVTKPPEQRNECPRLTVLQVCRAHHAGELRRHRDPNNLHVRRSGGSCARGRELWSVMIEWGLPRGGSLGVPFKG
jgi:hypothetical protein